MFLNHGEIYFKEQFFLPAVKENIPRKQITSSITTKCTHPWATEFEKIASQGRLHHDLGTHSPPGLKQLDLGSIRINSGQHLICLECSPSLVIS